MTPEDYTECVRDTSLSDTSTALLQGCSGTALVIYVLTSYGFQGLAASSFQQAVPEIAVTGFDELGVPGLEIA